MGQKTAKLWKGVHQQNVLKRHGEDPVEGEKVLGKKHLRLRAGFVSFRRKRWGKGSPPGQGGIYEGLGNLTKS